MQKKLKEQNIEVSADKIQKTFRRSRRGLTESEKAMLENRALQNPFLGARLLEKELQKEDIFIPASKIKYLWDIRHLASRQDRIQALRDYANKNPNTILTPLQKAALESSIKASEEAALIVEGNDLQTLFDSRSISSNSNMSTSSNVTESQNLSLSSLAAESQGSINSTGNGSMSNIQPILGKNLLE